MMRIKAGIDLPKPYKAANHQTGPGQQHQGHCHLGDDEYTLRTVPCSTAAPTAFFEGFVVRGTRHLQRGSESEENSGHQRRYGSKDQDVTVEPNLIGAGQRSGECGESSARAQV